MEHFFKAEEPFGQGLKQKVLCMGGYRYPSRRRGFPPHRPAEAAAPVPGGTILGSLIQALREGGISEIVLVVAPGDRNRSGECSPTILAGIAAAGDKETLVVCSADLPALLPSTILGGPSYLQEI